MSSTPFQPGHRFSDEELLAFVEGELTADQADRLSMRLLADPDLYRRLEQMRIHRSVLMSMPDTAAPADLADRVQQILEQRSLLDAPVGVDALTTGSLRLISDGAPTTGVRRATMLPRASWWQQRGALAAGIGLLLCGSAYWGYTAIRKTLPPTLVTKPIEIASNIGNGDGAPGRSGTTIPNVEHHPDTGAITANTTSGTISSDGPSETDIAAAALLEEDPIEKLLEEARPTLADLASSISLPDRPMSEIDALRLAREGRLAIRINTLQPTHAGRGMEKLTQANSETARSWRFGRLEGTQAAGVRASLGATAQLHATRNAERKERESALADSKAEQFAQGLGPIQIPNALPPMAKPSKMTSKIEADPTRPLYTVECDAKVGSLNAVRGLVTEYTRSSITFIELAEPVSAATDDASVVWWTQPPAQWAPRIHVPVVIGN